MNVLQFIFSLIAFIYILILSYEVWFAPKKFVKRLVSHRESYKSFLGFSYWENGYVNWFLVKAVAVFMLIITLISLIVSITGPIIVRR
jgi:hypothetical protein